MKNKYKYLKKSKKIEDGNAEQRERRGYRGI